MGFAAPCTRYPCQFLYGVLAATQGDKALVTRDTTAIFVEKRFRIGDRVVYSLLSDCNTQHGHVDAWPLDVKHKNPWLSVIQIIVGVIVTVHHSATCERAMSLNEQSSFVGWNRCIAPRCEQPGTFRLLLACDGLLAFVWRCAIRPSTALTCTATDVAS